MRGHLNRKGAEPPSDCSPHHTATTVPRYAPTVPPVSSRASAWPGANLRKIPSRRGREREPAPPSFDLFARPRPEGSVSRRCASPPPPPHTPRHVRATEAPCYCPPAPSTRACLPATRGRATTAAPSTVRTFTAQPAPPNAPRDRPRPPAARGPLSSRFAAPRPVSPPPAAPPRRSDTRRRVRPAHRSTTDKCPFRFTRPRSRPPPPPRCSAGTWCTAYRVGRGRLSRWTGAAHTPGP